MGELNGKSHWQAADVGGTAGPGFCTAGHLPVSLSGWELRCRPVGAAPMPADDEADTEADTDAGSGRS